MELREALKLDFIKHESEIEELVNKAQETGLSTADDGFPIPSEYKIKLPFETSLCDYTISIDKDILSVKKGDFQREYTLGNSIFYEHGYLIIKSENVFSLHLDEPPNDSSPLFAIIKEGDSVYLLEFREC